MEHSGRVSNYRLVVKDSQEVERKHNVNSLVEVRNLVPTLRKAGYSVTGLEKYDYDLETYANDQDDFDKLFSKNGEKAKPAPAVDPNLIVMTKIFAATVGRTAVQKDFSVAHRAELIADFADLLIAMGAKPDEIVNELNSALSELAQ